jgi:tetratricopeptide (TPR) repeat protein
LKRQAVFRSNQLRILFAGDGPASRELKYRAYDLGLGRQALFLHQDAEPFLTDLYAAADIIVAPRITRADCHEPLPLPLLEAMACGAVPLAGSGTVAAELAGDGGIVYGGDGPGSIAAELAKLLADPATLDVRRLHATRRASLAFAPAAAAAPIIADLNELIGTTAVGGKGLAAMLAAAREALSRGAVEDAIEKLEEADLAINATDVLRAELCCLRGDVAYSRSDLDGATEHYAQALQFDDRHAAALRGLGMVSWQGHSDNEALTFFRKALALNDDDVQTKLGMGLTYRRLGLNDEALHWLERCLEHDNAPETALLALAQTCAQCSEPERGIEVLERVVEGIGEQHVFLVTLGQLYLAAGRFEQGNEMLRKALANGGPSTAA